MFILDIYCSVICPYVGITSIEDILLKIQH